MNGIVERNRSGYYFYTHGSGDRYKITKRLKKPIDWKVSWVYHYVHDDRQQRVTINQRFKTKKAAIEFIDYQYIKAELTGKV